MLEAKAPPLVCAKAGVAHWPEVHRIWFQRGVDPALGKLISSCRTVVVMPLSAARVPFEGRNVLKAFLM